MDNKLEQIVPKRSVVSFTINANKNVLELSHSFSILRHDLIRRKP